MQLNTGNLFVRADAFSAIGTGHMMRCIALAQAWQDQGGDVIFLSHCNSEALRQRIIYEGFEFIPIEKPHPDSSDLSQTLSILKLHAPCSMLHAPASPWLALDGYHFTQDYQKAIRENGCKLLVIDDMAHLEHYHTDILLNQNIHASSLRYSCDRDTVKLLGCEYVLLRREFLKYKDWKREIPEKAKKILVTMGGADPDNVTLKVIKALNSLNDPDLEVKIVVGPTNPNKEALKKALLHVYPVESLPNGIRSPLHRGKGHSTGAPCSMRILENAANMPELMAWADIAVSAAGSTCWELAFMGVTSITIVTFGNQRDVAKGLERVKIFKTVGWYKTMDNNVLVTELSILMQDKKLREKKSRLGHRLINGKGAKNIVCALSVQHGLKR